uniref:Sodium/potassium-transporting ATPase subunit alpha n=1 Tax=Tetraselmis sp. GSL018 TaxID=582737 RepID=A0A061QMZ8_9CHLO
MTMVPTQSVEFASSRGSFFPCERGCEIPPPGYLNPFSEMTSEGFRGINASIAGEKEAITAACSRNCEWYRTNLDKFNGTQYITEADYAMFKKICGNDGGDADSLGFKGRGLLQGARSDAPAGAFYWWNGQEQLFPNTDYQANALGYAQTAYFVSIIVVQWADLLIAKTRKLSIFEQGMRNKFMNFGLCFETVLGVLLVYLPFLNIAFGTRPLYILHWFCGIPWSILIFVYDEIRKSLMRGRPGGWLEEHTYW